MIQRRLRLCNLVADLGQVHVRAKETIITCYVIIYQYFLFFITNKKKRQNHRGI